MSPDELLAAVLRGDDVRGPDLEKTSRGLLSTAAAHDIVPLAAERIAAQQEIPIGVREAFAAAAHAAAAADLAREVELRRLLDRLSASGIETLLVKGSHLAYTHYARPDLRARIDTDLLIARSDREQADAVLTRELGYKADAKPSGDLTATQKLYVLTRDGADLHLVDLHWRLVSPQAFAHVLSFEELRDRSVPLPALGPHARGPSNVDALLIACMHRVAHHHDEPEQFKWLYDVHLIAANLSGSEWDAFAAGAVERGIAAVALDSLERSRSWFQTMVPGSILADARMNAAARHEDTAAFLTVRPKAHEVLDDFRALRSWRDRRQLAREHLFPPAAYMREVYSPKSRLPLPLLYAWRIIRGARAWLHRR